ncbi:ankyrin-3-like [Camellia sinensis]|uniref:ankyrin-3-like n=1 Tax=Camellia sinensis TaxID=4442 RepID=UPI001035BE11|nr:ankyrin-3-like [Camellia sinensis]
MKLIEDNPRLLYTSALENEETPLHIASTVGHFNLVTGIMKLRKEFSQELNEDGLSPLHIASTNGHVEIVKELLKADHKLCLVKGRERRIPLHYATIKGRVDVIRELILASADSVVDVTARGETVLHLAVKNNQFEAFKDLVEHLKKFNKEDVLNRKDDQGNTFLHLAVSKKQYKVIDLVLKKNVVSNGALEINSLNKKGLTALDVFPFFQSEADIREIKEILRQVGAMIAKELHSLTQPGMNQNQAVVAINLSRIMKLRKEFSQELNEDGLSPLHIASTNGHVEIVKELLKADHKLCLVKGRERRIPLHYATIKGRVDVIRELILASTDSVVDVAARGEKVLHLAVKNNQFEAFKDLVEHLKKFNKEDVLNRKDDQGNTFLHLAVSKKQYKKNAISNGALEINSLNKKGLTALDVFPFFQSEADIREIKEILRQVGAMIAEELHSVTQPGMNQNQAVVAINLSNPVEDVMVRGETTLHLAVNNNQFEAFKVLVEHLKQFNKKDVLNMKDKHTGNNIVFHIAVSRKQYEAIIFHQ